MDAFEILRSKSSAPLESDAWTHLNNIICGVDELAFVVSEIDVSLPEPISIAVSVDETKTIGVEVVKQSVDVIVPDDDVEVESLQIINIDVDKCP